MTEKCPTAGYTCVMQLQARVQAVVDQLVGFKDFVEKTKYPLAAGQLFTHYSKASALLQEALDTYAEGHGAPDFANDIAAVQWVLNGLK